VIAALMDHNYGFVWLDADHPRSHAVKSTLKQTVIGELIISSYYYYFLVANFTKTKIFVASNIYIFIIKLYTKYRIQHENKQTKKPTNSCRLLVHSSVRTLYCD